MSESKKVNVLGTVYTIRVRKYDEDEAFERDRIDGYCDGNTKEIVICDLMTHKLYENDSAESRREGQKAVLRHEIVHAFVEESGLSGCSLRYDGGWAKNEEMIDWFALQGPKIYAAWQEAGAL